jgi:hypothetical protein
MNMGLRIGLLALAGIALGGCAMGKEVKEEMGWTKHAVPSDVVRSSCENAVKGLEGKPDHHIAMDACVDAKTRQHVD